MKQEIMNAVGKFIFETKKHSPEILLAVGIGGVIGASVMACRASTKLEKVKKDNRRMIQEVKTRKEEPEYKESEYKRDLTVAYVKAGMAYAKLYGPAIIIGGLSIGSIVESNNIIKGRNLALSTSYALLDTSFKSYRQRVSDRFGAEVEKEIYYNIHEEEIKETVVDENGKEKVVKKKIRVAEGSPSQYAVWFDEESSSYYDQNNDFNTALINRQILWLNNELQQAVGNTIVLNKVLDAIGIEGTKTGMVCGWVYDPENQPDPAKNRIDVKIEEVYRKSLKTGEYIPALLLDFNCSGEIYSQMPKKKEYEVMK